MAIHQNTAFRTKESEWFRADWVVRQCESGKEFRLQRRLTSRDYQWISSILSFHIDGVRCSTENKPWWVGQWWDIETYRDSVDLCRTALCPTLCGFSCFLQVFSCFIMFSSCSQISHSQWSEAKASAAWPRRSKMSPNLDGSCNWYEKIEIMTRFKKEPLSL